MGDVLAFRPARRTSVGEMVQHPRVLAVFFRCEGRVLFANTDAGLNACAPLLVPLSDEADHYDLVEDMMRSNRAAFEDIQMLPETLSFQPMSDMVLEGVIVDIAPEVSDRLTAGAYDPVPLCRIRECVGLNVFFHFLVSGLGLLAAENRAA